MNEANSYTEEVRRSIKEKYGFKTLYAEGLSIRTPLDVNYQIQAIISLRNGAQTALAIIASGIESRESRGTHYVED